MSKKSLPYPRPVSPLSIDEIPICPTTDVYYDPNVDDTDHEAENRAAKRRKRVRDNAEAYMRGESIHILTASLRGPFDGTWKNPWAKKQTRDYTEKEVPETNAGRKSRKSQAVPETTTVGHRQIECIDLTVDDIEFTQPPVVTAQLPKDVFQRPSTPTLGVEHNVEPMIAKRVEEWLKTNDAYKTRHLPDIRSSPTPTSREPKPTAEEDVDRRPLSAGGANETTQVGDWAKRFSSGQENESTQQTHESQDRAEAAILETKRRSVHRVPPSTHLPAFEYKHPMRPHGERPEHPLTPDSGSESASQTVEPRADRTELRSASSEAHAAAKSFVESSLSAEKSKATTIRDLPEAQIVSAIVPIESHAQSTAELLEPVDPPAENSTGQNQMAKPEQANKQVNLSTIEKLNDVKNNLQQPHKNPSSADKIGADKENRTPLRNLDTQALLGSIKPFAVSTIKKLTAINEENLTPTTATKARRVKIDKGTKKKASFAADLASDESQTSIKAGFQVRKAASINILATGKADGPTLEEEERYDLDPPTKDNIGPCATPLANALKTKTNLPKSILKSRNPKPTAPSSAPPGTTVTATGLSLTNANNTYQSTSGTSITKQDAQPRPRDMFAIENGPGFTDSQAQGPDVELQQFDLDAAVDTLGSFLGTWDVEQEVGGLA